MLLDWCLWLLALSFSVLVVLIGASLLWINLSTLLVGLPLMWVGAYGMVKSFQEKP